MSETIERIVERLRKDHPDPDERAKFYRGDKLAEYVRALAHDADDAEVARIAEAVRAAEDGTPAHDE